MERAASPSLNPALLPPGTRVGPWRVMEWVGHGANGAVYRAIREGDTSALSVALKVALHPRDLRFAREAELLSRQQYAHLPRLVEHGEWDLPGGACHPYLVMEWIDGVSLYEWGRWFHPSEAQVLRLLAQVALALQVLHAQGAVHRDVKGGNILVRRSDSRAFLMDLGSGRYAGADTLTPPPLPPGTPAYRSPEAWLFAAQHGCKAPAAYSAGPADDLYALGVTACVLVTGRYPEPGAAEKDEHGVWQLKSMLHPKALRDGRVTPPVRELILRLLSAEPEQRGTAAQLAQDMERAATALTASGVTPSASTFPAFTRSWRTWGATAAVTGALAAGAVWLAPGATDDSRRVVTTARVSEGGANAEPVGLGEAAASSATEAAYASSRAEMMAADTPPEPLPGQLRPDAKGRCPRRRQVALNGGCWMVVPLDQEGCAELSGRVYEGTCYAPIIPPGRPSTTTPTQPQ